VQYDIPRNGKPTDISNDRATGANIQSGNGVCVITKSITTTHSEPVATLSTLGTPQDKHKDWVDKDGKGLPGGKIACWEKSPVHPGPPILPRDVSSILEWRSNLY
jgi:hypothetical protein